ncbi:aminotransferase class I/II-fold pyridoxal phosphate-dependent enzyme [Pseudoxanthobacter sp.]|uniref:pyridoxal phosphate-dependent aminotransferase n=1 Tax=Pseudoxanthobacter sp. TaxID=1925742 RepID=UPI002FDFC221
MRFSSRVEHIGGESVAAWNIHTAAKEAQRRGEDVIVLSVGDPDFSTPAPIVERAITALRDGDTHYSEVAGRHRLRTAIAHMQAELCGLQAGPENIMVTAGAQNALFAVAQCLFEAGDEVIVPEPMYLTYPAAIGASGAKVVPVAVPAATGLRPDIPAIEAAVTPATRAIALANPNNPTGMVLTPAEAEAIAGIARRHDLWVIVDEVYSTLLFEGTHTAIAALPDMAGRTVTINSLSKSHAMTGWRVGWVAARPDLIRHLDNLGLCMIYGLPGFIQEAALTAVEMSPVITAEMRALYRRRRDLVVKGLSGVPGLRCLSPAAGMFCLVDVRETGLSSLDFAWSLFRETGVSVLDASPFGPSSAGFVRLAFTIDDASLAEATRRIAGFAGRLMRPETPRAARA